MKLFSAALPYLLLVTFSSGQLHEFDASKIRAINESPYDGVAVQIRSAYDTNNPDLHDLDTSQARLKKECKKHIWPWVFLNRVMGSEDTQTSPTYDKKKAFQNIKGMALYDEHGALTDFYQTWTVSLNFAKRMGSPGILFDVEAYNNYKNYQLWYLAKQFEKDPSQIKERLRQIGSELADIADKQFPTAIIWFTFTGLGQPRVSLNPISDPEFRTVTYIVQGMLDRAKEKKMKLKFVSGGMLDLGYCYQSLEDLQAAVKRRSENFLKLLMKYPNLSVAGTIAPWNQKVETEGYFSKGKCAEASMQDINDFKPLIKSLMESYQYVWIYAAGALKYNPYEKTTSEAYSHAIDEVVKEIKASPNK
jgi:hypothetical protein